MNERIVQLGDVSAVSAGQGAPQNRDAFGFAGTPFIRASSLDALCEDGSFSSLERIDEPAAKEHKLRLYAPGTVVFAKSGMSATKNRIYRLSRPAYVVNHLAAVVPSKELDSVFLRYWLEHFNPTRLIQDSAYPSISQENIESVSLSLPDLCEQQRIAGLLEQADRLRRTRRYALELGDNFLSAAFLELFGEPLSNSCGWPWTELVDICEKVTDGTHFSPPEVAKGIPYVTAKNIKQDGIDLSNLTYVSEQHHREIYSRCDPRPGDVLYIKDGATTGIAAVNSLRFEFSMLSSLALLRPKASYVTPEYLAGYLNARSVHEWITSQMKGGAIKRLTIERIKELPILVPDLALQQKFAALVERHERLRATQREALRQAEHLFQTLLHQAFSDR